jgi:hypothetical protein
MSAKSTHDVRGDGEVLMLYSSFNRTADSALIWQYGPFAQRIVVGITAGDPQPGVRRGTLSWEELSHDVIVASHFSPVVGIYNLEGCVRRGLLAQLIALDWNQPVIISADQNRQVIRFTGASAGRTVDAVAPALLRAGDVARRRVVSLAPSPACGRSSE